MATSSTSSHALLPLLLILDVDGVTRRGVSDVADATVMRLFNEIVTNEAFARSNSHFAFISGSQVLSNPGAADWRGCNVGLKEVFDNFIDPALFANGRCSVYGQLGSDRLVASGGAPEERALRSVLQQSLTTAALKAGIQLLVDAFLHDVEMMKLQGADHNRIAQVRELIKDAIASPEHEPSWIQYEVCCRELTTGTGSMAVQTPDCLAPVASLIREHLDPHFRLICNGASIECHTSVTEMAICRTAGTVLPIAQVSQSLTESVRRSSALSTAVAEVAVGIAHRGEEVQFRFYGMLMTTKGSTVKRMCGEQFKSHYIVTVGDGHIDYSMHRLADTSFHVGPRSVWETERARSTSCVVHAVDSTADQSPVQTPTTGPEGLDVAHVALVTCGRPDVHADMQLTAGTAAVLEAILETLKEECDHPDTHVTDMDLMDRLRQRLHR